MKKREPIELRKLKPEHTSARLSRAVTGLRTSSTRIYSAMTNKGIDDDFLTKSEEGIKLRKEIWAAKSKLDGLVAWLARIARDCRREESNVRTDRRLKELNVDPEEVLNREPH